MGMVRALLSAATRGKVDELRQLVARSDAEVLGSVRTPKFDTAVHIAALHGHSRFVSEALSLNRELLVSRNSDGDTPLHLAARAGKERVARLLAGLAQGWTFDASSRDDGFQHPLEMENNAGDTPLHVAVRHRREPVALTLIEASPYSAFQLNDSMESPLHLAAREGLSYVVWKILGIATVEQRPSISDRGTPLHEAARGGHSFILMLLVQKRPELTELVDASGSTALHYAAERNEKRMVKILLRRSIFVALKRNNDLQSPLHVASSCGSTEAIMEILKQSAGIAERANALKCLLRYVQSEEVVNRADMDGNTPLHLAVKLGRPQMCLQLLRDQRINPCIVNKDGQTAGSILDTRIAHFVMLDPIFIPFAFLSLIAYNTKSIPSARGGKPKPLSKFLSQYVELRMGTYTLVSTLIATVTFSSLFTMPSGYDQQDGTAVLGHHAAFKVFVVANTLAMLSSIIIVAWSHWLTIISCVAMVVSVTTAVYLTVVAKSPLLAYLVIAMGCSTPVVVLVMLGKNVFATPA
ncbi:hypothetical protein PAHAL_9G162700 [Panicum hallii]|uniref:PGG domain-containing protein n=1 Tax=Panicum hallii TaxID=206008 RepID=A0A2S3IK18_9POAL|nr:hypothetical protein PAHAL_9G162700 [Panicum hallii]